MSTNRKMPMAERLLCTSKKVDLLKLYYHMTNFLLYKGKRKGCEDKSKVMVHSPRKHVKMCLQGEGGDKKMSKC